MLEVIRARILNRGLDVCWPLTVGRYNATIKELPHLHLPYDAGALAIVVGHTKNFWEPFCKWYRTEDDIDRVQNPIETYTSGVLEEALGQHEERYKIYWAQDMEEGKLVAMNRAAEASLQCRTCPRSMLSVHPLYGPWLAFRALVVFPDVDGPPVTEEEILSLEDPLVMIDQAALAEQMRIALAEPSDYRHWVAVRDTIGSAVGGQHRYSEEQLLYHYTKRRDVLPMSSTCTKE